MSELVEFLSARLAEDERAARDAEEYWDPGAHSPSEIPHAGRWAPTRVLREVEAKRQILTEHRDDGYGDCSGCGMNALEEMRYGIDDCPVLLALTRPYAGHEAYRSDWADATPTSTVRHLRAVRDDAPAVDIPLTVSLASLEPWEQHIWRTPDLTVEQRRGAIHIARLQRGDLTDTGSVRNLYHALGNILRRQP